MSSNARSTPRSGRVSLAAAFIVSCDIVASIWWLCPGASPTPSYLPIAIMSGIFDPTFSVPGWLSAVVAVLPVRVRAQILEQARSTSSHLERTLVPPDSPACSGQRGERKVAEHR
jgi:hypothetical protein